MYRIKDRGLRLPHPMRGVHGHLHLVADPYRQLGLRARLTDENRPDALVLPELLDASVRRISRSGIVITGLEVVPRRPNRKANADRYAQTWWCLVHTLWVAESLDTAEPGERFATELPMRRPANGPS